MRERKAAEETVKYRVWETKRRGIKRREGFLDTDQKIYPAETELVSVWAILVFIHSWRVSSDVTGPIPCIPHS